MKAFQFILLAMFLLQGWSSSVLAEANSQPSVIVNSSWAVGFRGKGKLKFIVGAAEPQVNVTGGGTSSTEITLPQGTPSFPLQGSYVFPAGATITLRYTCGNVKTISGVGLAGLSAEAIVAGLDVYVGPQGAWSTAVSLSDKMILPVGGDTVDFVNSSVIPNNLTVLQDRVGMAVLRTMQGGVVNGGVAIPTCTGATGVSSGGSTGTVDGGTGSGSGSNTGCTTAVWVAYKDFADFQNARPKKKIPNTPAGIPAISSTSP